MLTGCVFLFFENTEKIHKKFFDKKYKKINLNEIILKIIKNKIKNMPKINEKIDYFAFLSLNLKLFPIFVINKNKLGENYLKLYKNIFEKLNNKINLVVLNGKIKLDNPNINVVCLNENKLNLKQMYILNLLNVNRRNIKSCDTQNIGFSNKYVVNNLELIGQAGQKNVQDFDAHSLELTKEENRFVANVVKGKIYKLELPAPFYNYLILGKRQRVITNIFGQEIAKIVGSVQLIECNKDVIILTHKNSKIEITPHYSKNAQDKMDLLKFDIVAEEIDIFIKKLKENAIKSTNNKIFVAENNVVGFQCKNIYDFFKVSNMRKNYFNDYIFLLKNVFGLKIQNDILSVNPKPMIDFDFSIHYVLDGVDYVVKYSQAESENVRLDSVAHKLGHQDDFVFGY